VYATRTWDATLKNQSIDACIRALAEIRGSIGKLVTQLRQSKPSSIWTTYDELWAWHRRFDVEYAVTLRYSKELSANVSMDIAENFRRFEAECENSNQQRVVNINEVEQISRRIRDVINLAETELRQVA